MDLQVFAKLLEESLTSSSNPETSLPADIYNKIETAVSIRDAAAAGRRVDLDKQGTRLWNLSSKLKNTAKDGELLCLGKNSFFMACSLMLTRIVRVFAFLLLDCAQRCTQGSASSTTPVMSK